MSYYDHPAHRAWAVHYLEGRDGCVLLAFDPAWKADSLPTGVGEPGWEYGKHVVRCVIRDTLTNTDYETKISASYSGCGRDKDAEVHVWNAGPDGEGADVGSMSTYFYRWHHCQCHRKADLRHQCGLDLDDECDGGRYKILAVTPVDAPDLVLYSEVLSDEELETRLVARMTPEGVA